MCDTDGYKDDDGKPKMSLLDPETLIGMMKLMERGLKKYSKGNWKKRIDGTRLLDAIFRHSIAIQRGEIIDPESEMLHSYHIACNAMMLAYAQRRENNE